MGLSEIEFLRSDLDVLPANPIKVGCGVLFGGGYDTSDLTQIWLDKDDYRLAPSNPKKRLFFVRKRNYTDLREKICKTFINCMVFWLRHPTFRTLTIEAESKLACLCKENYLLVPLKEQSKKSIMRDAGFARHKSKYLYSKIFDCGVIDIFINGKPLTRDALEDLFCVKCNQYNVLYIYARRNYWHTANLSLIVNLMNIKLHNNIEFWSIKEALIQ